MATIRDVTGDRKAELSLIDLSLRFGPMPAWRIRTNPPPGRATEADVLRIHNEENRLCELVDGILVEKDVGYEESVIAGRLLTALNNFVIPRKLGLVTGEGGMMKIALHWCESRTLRLFRASGCGMKRCRRSQFRGWFPTWRSRSSVAAIPTTKCRPSWRNILRLALSWSG